MTVGQERSTLRHSVGRGAWECGGGGVRDGEGV